MGEMRERYYEEVVAPQLKEKGITKGSVYVVRLNH